MKCKVITVHHKDKTWTQLQFICPGCIAMNPNDAGAHSLPVNTDQTTPAWTWDGNLERPTLSPSILTGKGTDRICHSYLRDGEFEFLSDSTHSLAGKKNVPMPDLPDWLVEDDNGE